MKTKLVGITGGIGSGKTTVINFIQNLGYSVYIADEEAKKLMNNEEIVKKIQFLYNEDVINEHNLIDRKKLASVVFNNLDNLNKLNNLIHPLVKKHFENWMILNKNQTIVFKEAAILFESGSYKECDYTILITAPLETRIERVMKRDNITKDKVLERIQNQWSDQEKAKLATFVIENVNFSETKSQILQIIERINKK